MTFISSMTAPRCFTGRSLSLLLLFIIFLFSGVNVNADKCAPAVTISAATNSPIEVSEKYILYQKFFFAEGFFVTGRKMQPIFIFRTLEDDPQDLENLRRTIQGVSLGAGQFSYAHAQNKNVHWILSGKQTLSPGLFKRLERRFHGRKPAHPVRVIHYTGITVSNNEGTFACADMSAIDPITRTTGGSVYLFTIKFGHSADLSVRAATSIPGNLEKLSALEERLNGLLGANCLLETIDLSYQDPILTLDGVRRGWVVPLYGFSIRE